MASLLYIKIPPLASQSPQKTKLLQDSPAVRANAPRDRRGPCQLSPSASLARPGASLREAVGAVLPRALPKGAGGRGGPMAPAKTGAQRRFLSLPSAALTKAREVCHNILKKWAR